MRIDEVIVAEDYVDEAKKKAQKTKKKDDVKYDKGNK